jgi:hypothetical protein
VQGQWVVVDDGYALVFELALCSILFHLHVGIYPDRTNWCFSCSWMDVLAPAPLGCSLLLATKASCGRCIQDMRVVEMAVKGIPMFWHMGLHYLCSSSWSRLSLRGYGGKAMTHLLCANLSTWLSLQLAVTVVFLDGVSLTWRIRRGMAGVALITWDTNNQCCLISSFSVLFIDFEGYTWREMKTNFV